MLVKEAAKLDAESTLSAYWNQGFPIDPEAIARQLDIDVFQKELPDGVSGMIIKHAGMPAEITVDRTEIPARRRFTVAHEIGHFIERTTRARDDDFGFIEKRGGTRNIHEIYADEFAGNLLMPEREVKRLLTSGYDLIRMAGHFGVSIPAMKVRLARIR